MMDNSLYKIRLIVLWTAAGLLVLFGGALLALQTDPGKAYVLEKLTSRLNKGLAGEVEVDSVSGPLLWGATLHDIDVRDARGNDVLSADEAEVTYSLVGLLGGELEFSRVELEDPELVVRRYDDGTLNLAAVTKPAVEPAPDVDAEAERDRFTMPRFQISNGTINYEDNTVTGVDARGSLRVSTLGTFEVILDEVDFATDAGPQIRPLGVAAQDVVVEGSAEELALSADAVVVDETSRIEGLRLTRTTTEGRPAVNHLSGSVEALTVTPRLAKAFSPGLELASPISTRATFEGTPDDLEVKGVATASEGGEVAFDGTIDASASAFDLAIEADDFRPGEWVAAKGTSARLDATGTVEGRRTEDGAIELGTRMSASNVEVGAYQAKKLVLGGDEPFVITLGPPQTTGTGATGGARAKGAERASREIKASGEVEAGGLSGGQVAVGALDGRVKLAAKSFDPGVPISYDVKGTAGDATYGEHTTERTTFDLRGTLVRAPSGAQAAVERLGAKGAVDVRGYRGSSLEVRRLDAQVDIEHTPEGNVGEVRANLDQLISGERTYGSGRINLDMKQGGSFGLSVRAVPKIAPQLPLALLAAGAHSEDFDIVDLSRLEIGRPGLEWNLRDAAKIRISDESVVIDSLVLEGPSQPIRLDGTYPKERVISAIIERLGLASLEGLLNSEQLPDSIREQLPEDIEDLAPEDLERAIPDEVEERISDEIRKRLPKF
jgi:hypothetical protein